ncbi:MAG TPA: ABC-type transport auxiliary lipoprotein family protein, partial [Candidatus Binataceae bacterium]|nr:ABC-type transport auxiliary lipoprotein family protein [Candidatus Binataceae bacterium]
VLDENLAQLLNTYRIEEYPWNHEIRVDYQIAIQVLNFETTADGQSLLRARWVIKDPSNGRDLYATETSANTPVGPGDTGMSAALSTDLGTLSQAIASQVTTLSQQPARASIPGTSQ